MNGKARISVFPRDGFVSFYTRSVQPFAILIISLEARYIGKTITRFDPKFLKDSTHGNLHFLLLDESCHVESDVSESQQRVQLKEPSSARRDIAAKERYCRTLNDAPEVADPPRPYLVGVLE